MRDDPSRRGYRPGEDIVDKVPTHAQRWTHEHPPLAVAEANREMAQALWAIAWVLDEMRDDLIDGP